MKNDIEATVLLGGLLHTFPLNDAAAFIITKFEVQNRRERRA